MVLTNPTYFYQECQVCGRTLRISVRWLGQRLVCQHCGCRFVATDPESSCRESVTALQRANQLLALLDGDGKTAAISGRLSRTRSLT